MLSSCRKLVKKSLILFGIVIVNCLFLNLKQNLNCSSNFKQNEDFTSSYFKIKTFLPRLEWQKKIASY
uniref:Putative secreted protein n=1 Tax=Lutzomyia longipalpis TaxID=7200 RepID=A0A7G3AP58_LUTLO